MAWRKTETPIHEPISFKIANEIRELKISNLSSLFTNVPVEETIEYLVEKTFTDDWFDTTYNVNLTRVDLIDLLKAATKCQLFQFNEALYAQMNTRTFCHLLCKLSRLHIQCKGSDSQNIF